MKQQLVNRSHNKMILFTIIHQLGSESDPWKSLSYAVQRIRHIRNHNNPPSAENHATIHISGAIHYIDETLILDVRDSFLTIRNYKDEKVILSGGVPLNVSWREHGDVLYGVYMGTCGEMYYGDYRMMKARSPNIGDYGVNKHYATGPYHKVAGFLVENDDCKIDTNQFSQNCPEENKNGFYLNDEMSPDWDNLDQTEVLVYHSWIAEYARVANVTTEEDGRNKVLFQEPLGHAPIGEWIKSGALRYLVLNNVAVLDMPGEYVCVQEAEDLAVISWIPPEDVEEDATLVMTKLEIIVQAINTEHINIEGLQFHHTTFTGLDNKQNFQHAAVVVRKSVGRNLMVWCLNNFLFSI